MHQRGKLIACGEKVADISYKQGGEGKKGKGEKKGERINGRINIS